MGEHRGAEGGWGPSREGSVVLDIGGDRGAAIIYTPDKMAGEELEIRAVGQPWNGAHTAVRRRDLHTTIRYAGVFGSLRAGRYNLRVRAPGSADPIPGPVVDLVVQGGRITELAWPSTGSPGAQSPDPPSTVNPA